MGTVGVNELWNTTGFDTVRRDAIVTWKLLTVNKPRIHFSGQIVEFKMFVNDL